MAFRHGKKTGIAFNGTDITAYLNESAPTHSVETAETTTYGTDSKTYIVGLQDGTVTLSGLFDGDTDALDEVVAGQLGTEDGAYVLVQQGYSGDDDPGIRLQFCKGELTSYEVSSPVADVVSASLEVNADGGLYSGVALQDANDGGAGAGWYTLGAGLSASNASVDNGASTTNGYVAQLHVVLNTLDGNTIVTVEDSADDAAWATLDTFTTVSGGTTTQEQISGTGTVDRYVRISIDTTAATTGSVGIAVGFHRIVATL